MNSLIFVFGYTALMLGVYGAMYAYGWYAAASAHNEYLIRQHKILRAMKILAREDADILVPVEVVDGVIGQAYPSGRNYIVYAPPHES